MTRMTDVASPLASQLGSSWSGPRVARWLGGLYALLIVLGAGIVARRGPGATTTSHEMSFERSVFTAVNAATLTGFQQAVPTDEYGATGRICIITLTAAGTLISLIIG